MPEQENPAKTVSRAKLLGLVGALGTSKWRWEHLAMKTRPRCSPHAFFFFLPLLLEIVRAMTHVINQGMAMYWGTSRWSAMEIMVKAGSGEALALGICPSQGRAC